MNIRTVALVLGGAMVSVAVSFATACSSSSNSGTPSGGDGGNKDASSSSSGSGGSSSSGSSGSGSSGGDDGGGSSSGCKADPSLHPTMGGSIYCGYTDAGAFNCMTGQQCCLGGKEGMGYAPEMCAAFGSTCTNGMGPLPIECEQPQDCTANGKTGAVCCLQGATAPAPVAGCDAKDLKSQGGTGITCVTGGASDAGGSDAGGGGCAAGDLEVCEAPGDCTGGKTCTPIRWKLYEIGVCL